MTASGGDARRPRVSTAKAVAERAGVSVTTVSRVLSGRADVIPQETQDRVIAAAAELRYRPNSLARALREGRTQTIGLIIPDISDTYFHQVARGVEDVAQAAGYMVIFCNTDRLAAKEQSCLTLLHDKRVDGIIFCGGGLDKEEHLSTEDWPEAGVVAIGPHVLDVPSVRADDAAAIERAVEHLAATGRTHILCVAGQSEWLVTQERLAGYRAAVNRLDLDDDPRLLRYEGFTSVHGHDAVTQALASGVAFDSVIAFDDYAALGALQALREAGLHVPGDVAIVGCDDIPFAALACPSLTSIRFPTYEFGATAARMVLDILNGEEVQNVVEFPFELRVRASTAVTAHPCERDPLRH
jgi:LacI family transcriptional regulator